MNRHRLDRRQFNALCSAAGLLFPAAGVMTGAQSGVSVLAADSPPRTVRFQNGIVVPAIGQGSWHLGQQRHPAALEEEALRTGISLGMSLIDTSGNYGDGLSEQLISHVIAGQRNRVFLVSKVETDQVSGDGMARACEASLARLNTDSRSVFAALASPTQPTFQRCGRVRTAARRREDPSLGSVQLQQKPDGRSLPCLRRRSLRDQSSPLQSQRPQH